MGALSYTNYSITRNGRPFVPGLEGRGLVRADQQVQHSARIFPLQLAHRVHGVGGAGAQQLASVHLYARQVGKGQPGHRQPLRRGAQVPVFVPGIAGGQHMHHVQLQLHHGRLHQGAVRQVRRVERSAKQTHTQRPRGGYSHARRTRNSPVSAASGEPGSTGRW